MYIVYPFNMSSPRHNVDSCIIGHRSYILLCRREKLHFLSYWYLHNTDGRRCRWNGFPFVYPCVSPLESNLWGKYWRSFSADEVSIFFTQNLLNVTCFIMCFFNKKQNHAQLSFTRTLSSEPFSKAIVRTQIYDLTLHKPNLHICPLSQNK